MTRKNNSPKRNIKKRDPKMFIRFIVIAILMMLIIDFVFWRDGRPYYGTMIENAESTLPITPQDLSEPIIVTPPDGEYFEAPVDDEALDITYEDDGFIDDLLDFTFEDEQEIEPVPLMPEIPAVSSDENQKSEEKTDPASKEEPVSNIDGKSGKIAIVIDDMGMNLKQSRAALDLPSEITLAFLPYAEQVRNLSERANQEGHETIIHAPMEAMSSTVPLGPIALKSDMNYTQFQSEFEKLIDSFEGYVGLNNHMGSKLTQEKEHMAYLMENLKSRNLYFLDSRTIHTSVAADMAVAYGVPSIQRDVFLDHEETSEYTANALKNVERIARETGSAVAIGHPKEITMQALRDWIPTLEKKGFQLVKLSELIE